ARRAVMTRGLPARSQAVSISVQRVLKPGGYLIFEIGEGQRDKVLGLFGKRWTEIETAWDLAGKPRVITARRA
ncbi:MAG: hypothetical protein HGA94_05540, partial [Candidatus Aminicenantes bacterium]|nr:hypothetical protein [Candidatus Aminicenantes bacterium]